MPLTRLETNNYERNRKSTRGVDFDGIDIWMCKQSFGVDRVLLQFKRYAYDGGDPIETVVWDSAVQFPDTDGGYDGINRLHVTIKDFCKTPTGFAVAFTIVGSLGVNDTAGDRLHTLNDLWLFSYTGDVATRESRWRVNSDRGSGLSGQTLEGVDFADNTWYFLYTYRTTLVATENTGLGIFTHANPLIAGRGSAQYSTPVTISGGAFTDGTLLTRGPDGFYVHDQDAGLRFYDVNGAFVERQDSISGGPRGISYRTGTLAVVNNNDIRIYGSAPVADAPPGKIAEIEVFPGDTQITYRITGGDSSITGYEISEDGLSGWSDITLDSDNDYILTGLDNDVEVIRYFRAVSDADNGPASDAVVATPTTDAPIVPPSGAPVVPVVPSISRTSGQIYGLHEFRGRFDISAGIGEAFRVFHSDVELILYTRDVNIIDVDVLTFSLDTVHFLPVEPLSNVFGGGWVTLSFGGRLTETPEPHERMIWTIQGIKIVGINKRQVIVTERQ